MGGAIPHSYCLFMLFQYLTLWHTKSRNQYVTTQPYVSTRRGEIPSQASFQTHVLCILPHSIVQVLGNASLPEAKPSIACGTQSVGTIISTLVKRPQISTAKGFASPSDTTNYVRALAVFLITLRLHHVGMTEHEVSPHRCVVLSSV